jgi:DNA replication protein DnaC
VKFVRFDVSVGDPRFGQVHPCPKCNQVGVALVTKGRPDATRMHAAAQAFIDHPAGFLSVYGGYGNGKTIALQAVVNACLAKGIEARYVTAHTLMDWLYEAFDKAVMDTDRGRIAKLAALPVLVIDEFEKARDTAYAADMQQHLIDERYRNKKTLGTVFAWNGDFGAIPWGAVVSRMREFPCIENKDSDMRPAIGEAKAQL